MVRGLDFKVASKLNNKYSGGNPKNKTKNFDKSAIFEISSNDDNEKYYYQNRRAIRIR